MKTSLEILVLFILNHNFISMAQPTDYKLELVQVLFRHGDRIPDEKEVYPKDPYRKIFSDIGFGQLTKIGMNREYKIGQLLRELYSGFLGDFEIDRVYGYSSDYDRTKMSLQLALAGLFRPTNTTSWNNDIRWLPVPTHYDPKAISFLTPLFVCKEIVGLYREVGRSKELQSQLAKYADFWKFVVNHTGISDLNPRQAYNLFNNLKSALSLGLPLPSWCSEDDFLKISELNTISQKILTYTPLLRRMLAGPTIARFLKNIDRNENKLDNTKMYLYCGHDINLAAFSNAHNFRGIPPSPDYGSALIVEKLKGNDDRVYLRMAMWTGVGERLIPLKVEGCAQECPLSYYRAWVAPILPNDEVRRCMNGSADIDV